MPSSQYKANGILVAHQLRGDPVNPVWPESGQVQRLIQGLFQDVSLASHKNSALPQTQTPRPSYLGELSTPFGSRQAQAHSGGGAHVVRTSSTQGRVSGNAETPRGARRGTGPLCWGLETGPRPLTQAETPPRA